MISVEHEKGGRSNLKRRRVVLRIGEYMFHLSQMEASALWSDLGMLIDTPSSKLQPDPPKHLVCAEHRDGWCATFKKTTRYQESLRTLCGYYITGPGGIEEREPDCPDCLNVLKRVRERKGGEK